MSTHPNHPCAAARKGDAVPACDPLKVLLVGAYPPPIGGNSIHIQRLFHRLLQAGHEARILDYLGGKKPVELEAVMTLPQRWLGKATGLLRASRAIAPETLVHFHVSALGRFKWMAPVLFLLFRSHPKVITIHSGSFIAKAKSLRRGYLRWLFAPFGRIITVNAEQRAFLESAGIAPARLEVIPAFLPAMPDPRLVPQTIRAQSGRKTLVVTSGDLTPTYNHHALIDCIERLGTERHLFIFAFYGKSDPAYAKQVLDRLKPFPEVVVLRDQPPEVFVSILSVADIYVRPTTVDGDAVAIREALSLGNTVLASDCVQRPAACLTFPVNRSEVLAELLQNHKRCSPGSRDDTGETNWARLLRIYREARQRQPA